VCVHVCVHVGVCVYVRVEREGETDSNPLIRTSINKWRYIFHTHTHKNLKDTETLRSNDTETSRLKDTETLRSNDTETQRHRDTKTQRHRDTETQRHRDKETKRQRDTEPQRHTYQMIEGGPINKKNAYAPHRAEVIGLAARLSCWRVTWKHIEGSLSKTL